MNQFVCALSSGGWAGITLVLALSATSCAQSPKNSTAPSSINGSTSVSTQAAGDVALTPVERRMRAQSQAFQKTVWEGALVGGASTSLLMAILTGQELVLLAGGGGAAAGGLAGSYVAHKQKLYSNKEDLLDSMTSDVRQSNEDTRSLIESVREVIEEDRRRLAAIQRQASRGEATQAALEVESRRISDNRVVMKQASQGAREKLAMFQDAERQYRQGNPGTDTARMQQQINAFNQNLQTLDNLVANIASA